MDTKLGHITNLVTKLGLVISMNTNMGHITQLDTKLGHIIKHIINLCDTNITIYSRVTSMCV